MDEKIRLYLVDDEPMAIEYLKSLLEDCNFPYVIAGAETNSRRALAEIIQVKPDVVFTDISMPFIDGLSLSEEIREKTDAKIFLLTAYEDFEYAKRSVKIGVEDYLLKNEITPESLHVVLEQTFQKIRQERLRNKRVFEQNIRNFLLSNEQLESVGDYVYSNTTFSRFALLYFHRRPEFIMDEKNARINHWRTFPIHRI